MVVAGSLFKHDCGPLRINGAGGVNCRTGTAARLVESSAFEMIDYRLEYEPSDIAVVPGR